MMGTPGDHKDHSGVIPRFCDELFQRINQLSNEQVEWSLPSSSVKDKFWGLGATCTRFSAGRHPPTALSTPAPPDQL